MAQTIDQSALWTDHAGIFAAVAAGKTFIVTRDGEPVAELRAPGAGRPTLVPREEIVKLAEHGVRIDPTRFRADLDRFARQDIGPR